LKNTLARGTPEYRKWRLGREPLDYGSSSRRLYFRSFQSKL